MLTDSPVDGFEVTTGFMTEMAETALRISGDAMERAVAVLLDAQSHGRRVYLVGNGGSASTASHFACDLAKTARVPGEAPIRAFALADNVATLTAWGNDVDFVRIFGEQVCGAAEPDDVVIAISASGKSPNIVAALEAARANRARTIALTGFDGGPAGELADIEIHVPSHDYGLVESIHLGVVHALTVAVRRTLEARRASQFSAVTPESLIAR